MNSMRTRGREVVATKAKKSEQIIVHTRNARCPIASPNAKYSQSASTVITAVATATAHVGVNNTNPTTTGINTSAVATRFQVMQTVLTGRLPTTSQIKSGFPTELYSHKPPVWVPHPAPFRAQVLHRGVRCG